MSRRLGSPLDGRMIRRVAKRRMASSCDWSSATGAFIVFGTNIPKAPRKAEDDCRYEAFLAGCKFHGWFVARAISSILVSYHSHHSSIPNTPPPPRPPFPIVLFSKPLSMRRTGNKARRERFEGVRVDWRHFRHRHCAKIYGEISPHIGKISQQLDNARRFHPQKRTQATLADLNELPVRQ